MAPRVSIKHRVVLMNVSSRSAHCTALGDKHCIYLRGTGSLSGSAQPTQPYTAALDLPQFEVC